jgi:PAS domain S-box-containing protein
VTLAVIDALPWGEERRCPSGLILSRNIIHRANGLNRERLALRVVNFVFLCAQREIFYCPMLRINGYLTTATLVTFSYPVACLGGHAPLPQVLADADATYTVDGNNMNLSPTFLSCRGELASLVEAFDWAATPLGPSDQWPDSLKTILNLVLDSNHPMVILWGPDLIQFYNDAFRKTLGPERHPSGLGQPGRECWREIWPIIGPQIESVVAGGPSTWHEDQLVPVTRHGSREDAWWTYGYSPIRDATGVCGVLVVCNDVTKEHLASDELKRVNERLAGEILRRRHEADRLKVLFQQAPGFMCVLRGPQHVFEFANNAYMRLVGHREILGRRVRDAIPEGEGQGYFELLDEVFTTGQPFFANEVPLLLQLGSGSPLTQLYIDFIYQPIIESDGSISGIFVEGSDVTEKKHAQDALRVSQGRLEEGMLAARMVVWDWDLGNRELSFSANAPEIFGADLERVARPWQLLHPDDQSIMKNVCEQAVAERGKFQAVVRIIHPQNGAVFWSDVRGKAIFDEEGQALAIRGIALDVTERKRAEEKLEDADRRKDEFLAMLAHELRNPLAPIRAAAQLLKIDTSDDGRVRQASEIIGRQVEHITSLVDDLLDVARVTRGQISLDKQPVDIRSLISDAVEQAGPAIESRGHRLVLPQTTESFPVLGDRKRLVQVIVNLLTNAAKYTPEGGNILVRLEAQDDRLMIVIQDDGIGIDPELLPRVFELFTQASRAADRSQGGLGIGLSLVKSLVESHSGSVTADSEGHGTGTKFTVVLPRYHEPQASAPHQDGAGPVASPAKALRIMIVDDNKDAALMLSMLLEAAGHETVVEHDPYRALERAPLEAPDVCLLDIGLPGMDGNELARRLRSTEVLARTVLIAVTGYSQYSDRKNSLEAGFNHYLVKPVNVDELVALLGGLRTQ